MPPSLFQPIQVGRMLLEHRVVMAPLTRIRADKKHIPLLPLMREHYQQRSRTPGTLIVSEGVLIAPRAAGYSHAPGIWSEPQKEAWKEIVHAVHGNKSYIFCQLWALGRQANQESLVEDDFGHGVVAPSSIPARRITGEIGPVPRELTITEIHEFIHLYALAAHHAIHEVGFDGVEIHGACGYLIDQFLRDKTNYRTDEYGGTVENRSRFGLEVVAAVVEAVGEEEKVSIRLSPWDTFGDMGMDDPVPQYTHFVRELKMKFPRLSYIHVLEPRVHGSEDVQAKEHESNDFIRDIWAPGVVVSAGGFIRQRAIEQSSIWPNELVAFGRLFTSNPDLPLRLMRNVPLTPYDRSTFYLAGDSSGRGYTDFQFAPISQSSNEAMLNSS